MAPKISMHSKRFFRVVLTSIDPGQESPESFALKLSIRTSTPLPRARQVVRRLPSTIKQGMSVDHANKLKGVIESMGGRVSVESYLVTPGVDEPTPSEAAVHLGQETEEVTVELRNCLECGEVLDEAATVCPSCKMPADPECPGEEEEIPAGVTGDIYAHAGSGETVVEEPSSEPLDIAKVLRENKFLIAAGILVVLLVLAIIKQ